MENEKNVMNTEGKWRTQSGRQRSYRNGGDPEETPIDAAVMRMEVIKMREQNDEMEGLRKKKMRWKMK